MKITPYTWKEADRIWRSRVDALNAVVKDEARTDGDRCRAAYLLLSMMLRVEKLRSAHAWAQAKPYREPRHGDR